MVPQMISPARAELDTLVVEHADYLVPALKRVAHTSGRKIDLVLDMPEDDTRWWLEEAKRLVLWHDAAALPIGNGCPVIRRADARNGFPIFGTAETIGAGVASVRWTRSQSGGTRRGGQGHHSDLQVASLLVLTDALKAQVIAMQRQRIAERERQHWVERIYLCLNVNLQARTQDQGHNGPLALKAWQVKDGRCYYCGAPVVPRCMEGTCEAQATTNKRCAEHQPQA